MFDFYDSDHEQWRAAVRAFVATRIAPELDKWERDLHIDDALWPAAAQQGLLGLSLPAEHGGGGESDYRYRMVVAEELARVGAASVNAAISGLEDLFGPYLLDLGTPEQQARWLPALCAGEASSALALTEPGAGSDLRGIRTTAKRDGDGWRVSGSKTFITNGGRADVLALFARTDDEPGGFTLFLLEKGMPGFTTGRPIETLGRRSEGVCELFLDDVPLPASSVLGTVGKGFAHLMERLPKERMSITCYALAAAEAALSWTLDYTRGRTAFGRPIAAFQNTKFELAELSTEIMVTRSFVNAAVLALNAGTLTPVDAARAKLWTTEMLQRVLGRCVQLHGGYGYTTDYPIGRAFVDARVQTIYGGTSEIMKEVIGRSMISADGR